MSYICDWCTYCMLLAALLRKVSLTVSRCLTYYVYLTYYVTNFMAFWQPFVLNCNRMDFFFYLFDPQTLNLYVLFIIYVQVFTKCFQYRRHYQIYSVPLACWLQTHRTTQQFYIISVDYISIRKHVISED